MTRFWTRLQVGLVLAAVVPLFLLFRLFQLYHTASHSVRFSTARAHDENPVVFSFLSPSWSTVYWLCRMYRRFQGWYDEREEKYVTDSDAELADFKDAFGSPLKRMSEASYFFKMGK